MLAFDSRLEHETLSGPMGSIEVKNVHKEVIHEEPLHARPT